MFFIPGSDGIFLRGLNIYVRKIFTIAVFCGRKRMDGIPDFAAIHGPKMNPAGSSASLVYPCRKENCRTQ